MGSIKLGSLGLALFGVVLLGLAGLNLYFYLEVGHSWFNLVAAIMAAGAGLFDLLVASRG